jgi:hypothetical protein
MTHRRSHVLSIVLLALAIALGATATASANGDTIPLVFRGTGTIENGPQQSVVQSLQAQPTDSAAQAPAGQEAQISRGLQELGGVATPLRAKLLRLLGGGGSLDRSFLGITHYDQFTAVAPDNVDSFGDRTTPRGGRKAGTPIEPPDQGMCAGNGYVLESVNSAARVYSQDGTALTPTISLDRLYGNPPLFDPTTGRFGTLTVDVGCYYDADARRWFHIALTLEFDPAGGFPAGPNHIDLAVSRGPNPLGEWAFYALPLQNDGTQGTPDDDCDFGPCFGDFPHIGADENGVYISTNEFDLFGLRFHGANVYAISKRLLARADDDVDAIRFRTVGRVEGLDAFGLWPSQSPPASFDRREGGTEWFLNVQRAVDDKITVWALTNTSSLDSSRPNLRLLDLRVPVTPFGQQVPAQQKPGDFPLGQCINDTTTPTPFGDGCWRLLLPTEPPHTAVLQNLNPNDPRMQQVSYAGGSIWAAHGTIVDVNGTPQDGVALYEIRPKVRHGAIEAEVLQSEQFGVPGAHLIYPAVAVRDDRRGAMTFTLVGPNNHPSAAYAFVSRDGVGDVHVAAAGVGTQDGLSGYPQIGGAGQRWGDYSAAAVDGRHIWLATEYIAQTCTLAEFVADMTCGQTRTPHANWATRIMRVTP